MKEQRCIDYARRECPASLPFFSAYRQHRQLHVSLAELLQLTVLPPLSAAVAVATVVSVLTTSLVQHRHQRNYPRSVSYL